MDKSEYIKMFQFENDYWWYRGLHEIIGSFAARHEKRNGGSLFRLFDAGCGTGRNMEMLSRLGQVEGIDYSPSAIELCRERGVDQAQVGDLNTWNPGENLYDVIVSNDVISDAGVKDETDVLNRFYRALKPGGIVILNLPAFMILQRQHDVAVSGVRRFRKYRTLKLLKSIGFENVRGSYRLPLLFFVMFLKKFLVESFSKKKEDVVSDLSPLPRFLNSALLAGHRFENFLIRMGVSFPFGSSLFLVCRKRER